MQLRRRAVQLGHERERPRQGDRQQDRHRQPGQPGTHAARRSPAPSLPVSAWPVDRLPAQPVWTIFQSDWIALRLLSSHWSPYCGRSIF